MPGGTTFGTLCPTQDETMSAVAAAMVTASNSCVEEICVVDAAAGAITMSTTAVKVAAR